MFTLTFFDIEYHTGISSWEIWNHDRTLMIDMLLFQLATRLNSRKTYEIEIHNEIWEINLYVNICVSNWHDGIFEPTNMKIFTFFHLLTRLLPIGNNNIHIQINVSEFINKISFIPVLWI